MNSSIKNTVNFVLLITSLTAPLVAKATADSDIQINLSKLNEGVLNIVGNADKLDVDAKTKLFALIDKSAMFDWDAMTCHAVSETHFNRASQEQKQLLTKNLKKIFINAYSSAFINNQGKKPIFSTFASYDVGRDPTQYECDYAFSAIQQAGFEKSSAEPKAKNVDYFLSKSKAQKNWRVLNVNVMDVDFMKSYRIQFNEEIRENGLNSLIQKLQQKNSY